MMGLLGTLFDAVIFTTAIKVIDKSTKPLRENSESKLIDKDRESLFKW